MSSALKSVLSGWMSFSATEKWNTALYILGLFSVILLVIDAGTGGTTVPSGWHKTHGKDDFSYYGTYNTDGLIPIYWITGIGYGMVELIRRLIPRDIVGGHVQKAMSGSSQATNLLFTATDIVSYAITSPLLGRYMDKVYAQTGWASGGGNIHDAMYNIAGVQFTVIRACMISSSSVPKGSLALNPAMLFDGDLDQDLGIGLQEDASDVSKDSHDGGIQEEPKSGNVRE